MELSPEFVLTKQTNQLFDLRKDKVMQVSEDEGEVLFFSKDTFENVYRDEEKIIVSASRFFRALEKVQSIQMHHFVNLKH